MVEENGKRKNPSSRLTTGRGGGPKTEAGKAIVRRNPIKHGVLAQTLTDGQLEEGLNGILNALHASLHEPPPDFCCRPDPNPKPKKARHCPFCAVGIPIPFEKPTPIT